MIFAFSIQTRTCSSVRGQVAHGALALLVGLRLRNERGVSLEVEMLHVNGGAFGNAEEAIRHDGNHRGVPPTEGCFLPCGEVKHFFRVLEGQPIDLSEPASDPLTAEVGYGVPATLPPGIVLVFGRASPPGGGDGNFGIRRGLAPAKEV